MWGMTEMLAMIPAVFIGLTWIGVLIFLITLAVRFVRAVEKIAEKFEGPAGLR